MKKWILLLVILFLLISCKNSINSTPEEENKETKKTEAPLSGVYYYENHWKANDGINETNYWYKITFSDYTGISDTANGSFIFYYKYYYYFRGSGWTYSDDWDVLDENDEYSNWSWISYLYEVNEQDQLRTCTNTIPFGEWSEWSNYILTDTTLTMTINSIERTYALQE